MKLTTLLLAGTLICSFPAANAQHNHVIVSPDKLQWMDGPPGLPAGAKVAVLSGDPAAAGLFTVRLKFPAGYVIPAHWHPTDELVTVISGKFQMGMGDKYQKNGLSPQRPGSFMLLPAKMTHYAGADEETIVQVNAMGPFEINYVDPNDDPRKKVQR
ncbi:cupin domain-containing protein [Polluticoccus soli]|uniref:cupin domain-containing protein n=1 Tax=Polluticoccus soli TaxID=3034150 RepID=UPI0023E29D4C|nr:cupin domain-containing protein [Flavipsychrobacter sp. JY13-12]